jgi:pyrimidine and pyridine-specific 5'-nucleotidase
MNMLLAYIVSLGLSDEEASQLREHYYTQYGLALRGLRRHHGVGNIIIPSPCFLIVKGFILDPGNL